MCSHEVTNEIFHLPKIIYECRFQYDIAIIQLNLQMGILATHLLQ